MGVTPFTGDRDIANELNNFFSTVASSITDRLPNIDQQSHRNFMTGSFRNFFLLQPVTIDECKILIKNLRNTKTNVNHVPVSMLKKICDYIVKPLVDLINESYIIGKFPDILKISFITPIFKTGNTHDPSNYRPISCLPVMSKIFERSVVNRLMKYCETNSLIYSNQFGFRLNRSTFDALREFTEDIYHNLDYKCTTYAILVDLKKAFDCVNHEILLSKLDYYGIRGAANDWFRDYLTNRYQHTRIGSTVSSHLPVTAGVPQGSILGPILFLLYINDLPNATSMNSYLFADDTNFVISNHNEFELISDTNSQLNNVQNWCNSNRLIINSKKTEIVRFTNSPQPFIQPPIQFAGESLNFESYCKFLGVLVDNRLNFSNHISKVLLNVTKRCGILFRIREKLPLQARLNFYHAFIYPLLSYNISIWGGTNSTHLAALIVAQKRVIRTIAGAQRYDHTTPLFSSLKILKLPDIYKYQISVYMFENNHNPIFQSNHQHDTRNRNLLNPVFHRLSRTQQAMSSVGPRIWNSLPNDLKLISTLPKFKTELKCFLLSNYDVTL